MKKFTSLTAAVVSLGLWVSAAPAAQINGFLSMTSDGSTWTGDTANVNTITTITSFGATRVDVRNGDFASIPALSPVTMGVPLDFVPPTSINNPLWSVGGFSFALTSITNVNRVDNATGLDTLGLAGTGTISHANFDPTPGEWVWSGDLNGTQFFTFSSTTVANPRVPDGGSAAMLLGAALLGLAAAARRMKR